MTQIIAAIVALALLTLQPSGALAVGEHSGFGGVWQGTLSGQPIRACFNQADGGSFGAYYYLAHLQTIALQQSDDEDRTFIEGLQKDDPKAPRWTFDKTEGVTLTGHWSAGARSLPIRLSRVPQTKLKADETPCGSMLFHGPRLQGVHTVSSAAVKD